MSEVLQKFQVFNGDIGQMIPKPRYPKGSGASHNKKAPESSDAFWQGQKDSNPQQRFWRPTCYHYTMPLRIQQKRLYQNRRQKSIYKLHQKEKMLLADPTRMACGSAPPTREKSDLTRERGAVSARLCARRLGRSLAMGRWTRRRAPMRSLGGLG